MGKIEVELLISDLRVRGDPDRRFFEKGEVISMNSERAKLYIAKGMVRKVSKKKKETKKKEKEK